MLKKAGILILRQLIVLTILLLIFSTVSLSLPNIIGGLFSDIFLHASPKMQKAAVNRIAETCSSLQGENEVIGLNEICSNQSKMDELKEGCKRYRQLKQRNIPVENEMSVRETCANVESGELEKSCRSMPKENLITPDLSRVGALCNDFREGRIDEKEFFYGVVSGAIPFEMFDGNDMSVVDKYNKLVHYLNENKIVYFMLLTVFLILLFLLIRNLDEFLDVLARVSLSLGIFILLPYFAMVAYDHFAGLDTTSILQSMFSFGYFPDLRSIFSVIILLLYRTFTPFIIVMGFIFFGTGISRILYRRFGKGKLMQKIINWIIKRRLI